MKEVIRVSRNDRPGRVVRRTVAAVEAGATEIVWTGGRGTIATMSSAAHDQVVRLSCHLVDVSRSRGATWRFQVIDSDDPAQVDAV